MAIQRGIFPGVAFPAGGVVPGRNRCFRARLSPGISAILFAVRKFFLPLIVLWAVAACVSSPLRAARASSSQRQLIAQAAPQQTPATRQAPQTQQPQSQPETPHPNGAPASRPTAPVPMIVLDPAHGGTDTGARGENSLTEKEVVLQIARTLQAQLLTQGYHVVMTRSDDSNPSYDDRAAVANAYRNAVFITIHVGSSGKMGTVRAFYDQFWSPVPIMPSASPAGAPGAKPAAKPSAIANIPANTLISWQQAQRPYVEASHRLADILQLEFAQTFPGSPVTSTAVPLRDLRSVAGPAVAIEISNVSTTNADTLLELSGPLSVAIERAVQTFRQIGAPEAP
jgi:N-acetylmuramoyl-L-alanine amidase